MQVVKCVKLIQAEINMQVILDEKHCEKYQIIYILFNPIQYSYNLMCKSIKPCKQVQFDVKQHRKSIL